MIDVNIYIILLYATFSGLKKFEEEYSDFTIPMEDQIGSYFKIRQQLDHLGKDLLTYTHKPQYLLQFLQPGRMVKVGAGLGGRAYSPVSMPEWHHGRIDVMLVHTALIPSLVIVDTGS